MASFGFGAQKATSFGGFGSGATTGFGSTAAAPAFGSTSSFGAPAAAAPAFGASTTGFGATPATSSFGSTSTGFGTTAPAFGASSAFGAPAATAAAPAFGSSFGSTPAATTTSAFGASAPAFGTSTGFGAPAVTGTSAFGSTPSAFGSAPSAFGSTPSAFGAAAPSAFGSTPSAFGSAPSAFGTAPSASAFGSTPMNSFTAAKPSESIPLDTLYKDLPEAYRQEIDGIFCNFKKPMKTHLFAIAQASPSDSTLLLQKLHLQIISIETTQLSLKDVLKPLLDECKGFHREFHLHTGYGLSMIRRTQSPNEVLPNKFYLMQIDRLAQRLDDSILQVANISRFISSRVTASTTTSVAGFGTAYGQVLRIGPSQLLTIIKQQTTCLRQLAHEIHAVHALVEEMRASFNHGNEPSPFELADRKEAAERKQAEQRMKNESERYHLHHATSSAGTAPGTGSTPATQAFGTPAATPAFGLGAPATTPSAFGAPAATPSGFGSFAPTTPAATPGAFGAPASTPAAAPAFGLGASSFGSTPAAGTNTFAALDLATGSNPAAGGFGGFAGFGSPTGNVLGKTAAPGGGGNSKGSKNKKK